MPKRIVILSGAGLSAESGLGTFRDKDGLWTKYDLAEVATPEGFAANPALVHGFYNARRANCLDARPNAAHAALAALQRQAEVTLVTQNVDDLLERAGARDVIHMHGQLNRALCAACGHRWDAPREMAPDDPCPACARPATRPDIVWFGEIPYHMAMIEAALAAAELFVSIGTSGEVYPAAGFVQEARAAGIPTLELNLEPSSGSALFTDARYGPATEIVPAWVAELGA
ncbi:NAD-dependent deacetylase [Dinoroseobacter shibae DFL 12 = DSM 16493]|jgi:NAD-dependent deacetylase|uniref:NAD-dependent protein deacylase n=2 Tax=Pseudomonadota TaxID=1224 RepID=A8LI11_DINSH|nr:NAD-dependent deacylase [Dinoroseobacter shibae]ABV94345.1 NAD-dependent deacetylase [Dinoroseobacter shibae DFL 12 = DSM 16493]URF45776.1 NAD-dependent deacylase [Dinoroseobacter shibae]URF50082.1 NAD-dependent deacylase [Dinoroseobacter shibae]